MILHCDWLTASSRYLTKGGESSPTPHPPLDGKP